MTEEDKKQVEEVAIELERAVNRAKEQNLGVGGTFSTAVWAAARLRHLTK